MSGGGLTVVPSTLVLHEIRGLPKRANEIGDRSILLEQLPENDPSECRYCVTVFHPSRVLHTEGSIGRPESRQEPEIVYRGCDEAHAKRTYHTYAKVLGGAAPDSFDPKPSALADADATKRIASLERTVDEMRAAIELLTKKK